MTQHARHFPATQMHYGLQPALGACAHAGGGEDPFEQEEYNPGVLLETRRSLKKPSMYKVVMLNDDYTPMDFVVLILQKFFGKTQEEATSIMLDIHQKGAGVCGIYTYEVAETKVTQVMDYCKQHQHPLQCTLEKT